MIDHLSSYTTDYVKAKQFYEAVFAPLGYTKTMELVASWDADWPARRMCAFGHGKEACFWLVETKEPATPRHVAFKARDREAVKAFHAAALKHGAEDHGAPGLRPQYHEHYFGAFVIDHVCSLPQIVRAVDRGMVALHARDRSGPRVHPRRTRRQNR